MWRSFLAEWPRIRRRSVLAAAVAMVAISAVGTYFTLARAHQLEHGLIAVRLEAADGFEAIMAHASMFFAVTALITVASVVGAEWSQGTLRNLLVQEPGRIRLLAGKFCALLLYVSVSALVATAVGYLVATIAAPHTGIDTSAWTNSDGIGDLADFLGNLVLAITGWSVIGLFMAVLVRNAAGAVGASIAWLLVVEGLASEIWPDQGVWLPGHVFGAILQGGTASVAYGSALIAGAAYTVAMLAISGFSFHVRDVLA